MTATRVLALVAAGAVVATLASGCEDTGTEAESPMSQRPTLDDSPGPGPVPAHDGLSDSQRVAIVASTVRITGRSCGMAREGSGFAVGSDLVATSAHVLLGVDQPQVELADGRRIVGVPVAFDPVNDLAVMAVAGADLRPLELGTAPDGTIGVLVGWRDKTGPEPTPFRIDRSVTVRIDVVAGDERVERNSWLVSAAVEPGDSGAALVDGKGVAVGVTFAATKRDDAVAYATRASQLQHLLEEMGDSSEPVEIPDCR